ncbi:MAG: permease [Solirubrobacterales bacterium]|nr:permease [Solirubrobacterales bacterium]
MAGPTLEHTERAPGRVPIWALAAVFWLVILVAGLLKEVDFQRFDRVATFGITFASIVIEALPFILIGSMVSAAMAVYVPDRFFARIAALPRALQVPGATLAGFAFPVCECGSVPVGRRLIVSGIAPAAALGFMFAAQVLNPVVLVSTWVAYGGGAAGLEMTLGRAVLGFIVAMVAGLAVSRGGSAVLKGGDEACEHPGHGHGHEHVHADPAAGWRPRLNEYLGHMATDLLFMARFLVLGAAVSALMQTFIPQQIIGGIAGTVVLGTLTLMAMAFVLSLCSEADAFVAVSFTAFPRASQLAFLVFGPILDAKLAALYGATFRRDFVPRLLVAVVPLVLVGTALFGRVFE